VTERSAFDVLGVPHDATEAVIRSAWRTLAAQHHPDVGGQHETMLQINAALETALRLLRAAPDDMIEQRTVKPQRTRVSSALRDMSSFTVSSLPVEAWHLLEIAAAHCGQVIDEEPPYLMEFYLHDAPFEGVQDSWCRCELAPEAGATTVHLSLVNAPRSFGVEDLRDFLVDTINEVSER
jgi:hypothetical protein